MCIVQLEHVQQLNFIENCWLPFLKNRCAVDNNEKYIKQLAKYIKNTSSIGKDKMKQRKGGLLSRNTRCCELGCKPTKGVKMTVLTNFSKYNSL